MVRAKRSFQNQEEKTVRYNIIREFMDSLNSEKIGGCEIILAKMVGKETDTEDLRFPMSLVEAEKAELAYKFVGFPKAETWDARARRTLDKLRTNSNFGRKTKPTKVVVGISSDGSGVAFKPE